MLWVIFGFVWVFLGPMMIGFSMFGGLAGSSFLPATTQVAGILGFVFGSVLIVVGIALMLLGFLASFLKVVSEMTAEEVAKQSMGVPSVVLHQATAPTSYQYLTPPQPPPY